MLTERIKRESGYSLVEVMASIIILAIAILPMVAMFDMGLKGATAGSNYDKSRALANLKMEEAKSLNFAAVENNFPEAGNTTPYDSAWLTEDDFTNFEYRIKKQYIEQPPTDLQYDPANPSGEVDFAPSDTATGLIKITVTVRWADGNEYTTFGLVSA